LPWPVFKGVITETFGEHEHPVLKGIRIKNNGLDISTEKGGKVRAVFDGEVSSVVIIQGMGKVIMVRHGEYLTIYSNLEENYVKSGDKVKIKQEIGKINYDANKGKTVLHFELWKGIKAQDPQPWLYLAK